MSRTQNASRNIFWGAFNKIITIIMPFISRTVMIYTMGMQYAGLGSLFTSLLHVLSFAELGIGGALVFSMYKPMAEGDDSKVCALLNFYRKSYRVIGCIILACGLFMMLFLDKLIAGEVPDDINLYLLFSVYLLNNVLGYFLFAYKQSLFTASQRVDIISKIGMVLQFLSNLLQIGVLIVFHNYYMYVIILPIITCLNNICIAVLTDKHYPKYKCEGKLEEEELNAIKHQVGGMMFQKIGNIILTSVDTVVISAFLGLQILGVYNGYYYVITALLGCFSVIQQALIPSIGNSVVIASKEKNYKDFKKFHFLYLWLVIWCCCCMLCLYQPFIKMWQGEENMFSMSMVILFVIYFFTYKMGDVCWIYREAIGLWWQAKFIPFVSSIVNLILNIALVRVIGLPGIVLSTILSLTLINLPWSSKVLFTNYFKLNKQFGNYLLKTGFYFVSMCIVASITWLVCSFVTGDGLGVLIVRGIICCILPNLLLLIINLRNSDFKDAVRFVLKIIPKRFVPGFVQKWLV